MAPETYIGEVYDDGQYGVNFRLRPSTGKFGPAVNGDPAKLALTAKTILNAGGVIQFPSTDEIRGQYPPDSYCEAQVCLMRAFTADEQKRVLADAA